MGLEDAPGLDVVPEFDNVTALDNVMGLEFSANQVQSIHFPETEGMFKSVLVPLADVAEPESVGAVVAVLAWVGAWPLSTVDPGVSPSFTALQTYPASGLTRHWVPVGQHQYPGSFGT